MSRVNDIVFGPSPVGNQSRHGFYPWDVVAMSAAIDGEQYFSEFKCQKIIPTYFKTYAKDIPCDDPAATLVPYKFQEYPFVDILIDRLCSDGRFALSNYTKLK